MRERTGHPRSRAAALAAALLCAFALLLALPGAAFADFTISVAYDYSDEAGVYEKAVFTDEEMDAMSDHVTYQYATFDSGGWLRKGFGWGVELKDLYTAAGVTSSEISRFDFLTEDSYVTTISQQWDYSELIQETRYYYPDYIYYYDFDAEELLAGASSVLNASRVEVPTIIACESSYERIDSADDEAWDDSSLMSDSSGYRLMYGATSVGSIDSRGFANRMTGIVVRLNGEPSIVFDQSSISGEIGDEVEITATIVAEDEAIEEGGLENLVWESSNSEVLSIVGDDGEGTVTVRIEGEGETSITASFDGVSSSIGGSFSAPAEDDDEDSSDDGGDEEGTGGGSGGGSGTGEGTGTGSGSGSGSGSGTGSGEGSGSGSGTGSGEGSGEGEGTGDEAGEGEGGGGEDEEGEEDVVLVGAVASLASNVSSAAGRSDADEVADAVDADAADEADASASGEDAAEEGGADGDETGVEAAAAASGDEGGSGGGGGGGGGSGSAAVESESEVEEDALSHLVLSSEPIEVSVETSWPYALLVLLLLALGFCAGAGRGLGARDGFAKLRGAA